jgi:DNA-binding transcriptional LysR family regulator
VQWQTVVGLVATGLGVSLVTQGVRSLRIPGVVYRPLPRSSATTSIQLVTRAGDDSPILASLRSLVREWPGFPDGAAWTRG